MDFNQLESILSSLGWNLDKMDDPSPSTGRYVARISGPAGQKTVRDGDTRERALANAIAFAQRNNQTRSLANVKVASWRTPWRERLPHIAKAYSELPVYDEKAVPAWQALAAESKMQADAIRNQLSVKVTDDPEPYQHVGEMLKDMHHRGSFIVSRAHGEHPVWTPDQLTDFRLVHDVLGHGQTGADFSWDGENKAVEAHLPHVSPLARRALMTETLGKTAYTMHKGTHGYGPQKIALMEDMLGPVEKMNGEHVAVPHGKYTWAQPVMAKTAAGEEQMFIPPHSLTPQEYAGNGRKAYSSIDPDENYPDLVPGTPVDPNHFYSTPSEYVSQTTPAGHPNDYLNRGAVENNVAKFDQPENPFIQLDPERQRMAIRNAFATVILSPKKDLLWNAAHYQAIADLPSSATPGQMFDRIMSAKNYHNYWKAEDVPGKPPRADEIFMRNAASLHHANYNKQLKFLQRWLMENQGMSEGASKEEAVDTLYRLFAKMEPYAMVALEKENEDRQNAMDPSTGEQVMNKAGRPKKLRKIDTNDMRLRIKTWELVGEAMRQMIGPRVPKATEGWQPPEGLPVATSAEKTKPTADIKGRYGGAMYDHLEAISRMTPQALESMRQYAVKDITEDAGRGFIFRAGCQALNISGIGPKTASFAWLLLNPQSSELGILDTHAMRALGYVDEDALTDATYHGFERMQRAAKDSSGYADMPQGKYHWGMWDMVRSPGHVSDHSSLRPYNAQDWQDPDIDWGADHGATRADTPIYNGHPSWEGARPIMEQVMRNFKDEFPNVGKAIPPSHYAQGLLPNQPSDMDRQPRIWKPAARATVPQWLDPNTLEVLPEHYRAHEPPSVRAASWQTLAESEMHFNPAKYMQEAKGNINAAQQLMAHDLEMEGYNDIEAWHVAGEALRNFDINNKPCPNCGSKLYANSIGMLGDGHFQCPTCHHEFYQDAGNGELHSMGLNPNAPLPEFPEATGETVPNTLPWSEREQQYYRTGAERCPGTWQTPTEGETAKVTGTCPECGANVWVSRKDRMRGKITPHRPGGGRVYSYTEKTADWHELCPHCKGRGCTTCQMTGKIVHTPHGAEDIPEAGGLAGFAMHGKDELGNGPTFFTEDGGQLGDAGLDNDSIEDDPRQMDKHVPAFFEYVTQHNNADRDSGEHQDIPDEEMQRLLEEFKGLSTEERARYEGSHFASWQEA